MHLFTFWQWVFLFFLCCFFGWCMESVIVSFQQRKPVNRGFLCGPFIPLYGFGTLVILGIAVPLQQVFDNPFVIYVCGIAACTALEYVTGTVMEGVFQTRFWEYDDEKGNYRGRICVKASLFWGALTLLMVYVLQPLLAILVNLVPQEWLIIIDGVLAAYMLLDVAWSFHKAFDLKRLIDKLEAMKMELASAKDTNTKEELKQRVERTKEDISSRLERFAAHVRRIIRFNADGTPRWNRDKNNK